MDKVATSSLDDRAALFGESGAQRGVANTIIEKDFWVCWCLRRLFGLPKDATAGLVFKGGTSLSKAFSAIRRFSEDIDLSFDRAELGYTGDRDPENEKNSRNETARLIKELVKDVEEHISSKLVPALQAAITTQLGDQASAGWSLQIDASDPQGINFFYPTALPAAEYDSMAYITPRVKLELGARGDPYPTESKLIRPYAADDFPGSFEDPDTSVIVLSARRTFWEKATALHMEANRKEDSPAPRYFSRHYYDLAMLLDTEEGQAAATDVELLAQVTRHKSIFFPSGWANYAAAKPGSLMLMPSESRIKDLRADYFQMAPMMFDDKPPTLDAILEKISALEKTINN